MPNTLKKQITEIIATQNPSDIHIRNNYPIFIRKNLRLKKYSDLIIQEKNIINYLEQNLTTKELNSYQQGYDIDFRAKNSDQAMRMNAFHMHSGPALAIRILHGILPIEKMSMPKPFMDLFHQTSGLIIVSGVTGSGKSTCIASIIQHFNHHLNRNVLTVENPIEYLFKDKQMIFSQREVSKHTNSMLSAIEGGLRQDPDIIFIGEIRTSEEIAAALTAAETGHLVITTLHSSGFINIIHRIVDAFDQYKQKQIVQQLSHILLGTAALQLIRDQNEKIHLASEITICNDAIKSTIRSQKLEQAANYIQGGKKYGMRMLTDHIEIIKKTNQSF